MMRVAWFDRWQLFIPLDMQWFQKRMARYNVQICGHIEMRFSLLAQLELQLDMAMSIRLQMAAR